MLRRILMEIGVEEENVRVYKPRINFENILPSQFMEYFRISSTQCEYVLGYIGNMLQNSTKRSKGLSPQQQLLLTLHWLGNGAQLHGVGAMHGVSKSTVCRTKDQVVNAIVETMLNQHVKWSTPHNIATQFLNKGGFPSVCGCVDGTLINIDAPYSQEEFYVDRHGNHSLNVMVICGPNYEIFAVNANWPGSTHDSRVIRNSAVFQLFESGWRPFPVEVIFLIWGIRLCIVVRKAPSEFNESRFISMAIYNEFLLSVFLNISMFFLQSPANPDLLYIIFFCHTQLTITLLLCFIFGSKAYMVFKGHGKGDHEGSSMVAKTPGAKFINKSRSGVNSQYATSTNSSAGHGEYAKVTEQDIQEEFRRLYAQLEILKDKNLRFGNRHLTAKISAMQEAAARQDSIGKSLKEENEPNDDKKKKNENSRFNNVFSAMADKLTCAQAITPGEESTSSGREYITEVCESSVHTVKSKNRNVTFSPVKNGSTSCDVTIISENDNTNKKSIEDNTNNSNFKSPKSRLKGKSSPAKHSKHEDINEGCDKCLSTKIETENDELEKNNDRSIDHSESDSSVLPKAGQSPEGDNGSPNHTPGKSNKNQIKSGHARTHAIVINLDDKSRFTEEVTV